MIKTLLGEGMDLIWAVPRNLTGGGLLLAGFKKKEGGGRLSDNTSLNNVAIAVIPIEFCKL
jgi:hypothetical protein